MRRQTMMEMRKAPKALKDAASTTVRWLLLSLLEEGSL